jgi:peptidoglycan/LPS O-acetylase OafA/YrhL
MYSTSRKFIGRKVERLFFPLLTIGTLQYVLHAIVPGTNVATPLADIWKLYVYSHDQFWFLHAIFLVFLTVVLLDGFRLMDRMASWCCCLVGAVLLSFWGPRTEVFSFTGYLQLLPFFVLGCGVYRFPERIFRRDVIATLLALLAVGFWLQEEIFVGHLHVDDGRINLVAFLVGLTGTVVLFALRRPVRWLAWLGGYSYGIFLLHVFPVAGSRIVLMKLGLHNREALFAVGLVCGVTVPILLEVCIRKNPRWQRFLLGERAKASAA